MEPPIYSWLARSAVDKLGFPLTSDGVVGGGAASLWDQDFNPGDLLLSPGRQCQDGHPAGPPVEELLVGMGENVHILGDQKRQKQSTLCGSYRESHERSKEELGFSLKERKNREILLYTYIIRTRGFRDTPNNQA